MTEKKLKFKVRTKSGEVKNVEAKELKRTPRSDQGTASGKSDKSEKQ